MGYDNGYSHRHGLVQDRNTLRAVAQIDAISRTGTPNASLLKWAMPDGARSVFNQDWDCIRMAMVHGDAGLTLVSIDPYGRNAYATMAGMGEATLAPPGEGPDVHGLIRDMQTIGDAIYATGMGRQVYRRGRDGHWARHDDGVLQPLEVMEVVGFNAIHGLDEDTLYAAGLGGEVWCCRQGAWTQLDSPVTSILNAVHVLHDGRVLVAGQHGVLAVHGGGRWQRIATGISTQIWDIHAFGDAAYLATSDALYRLDTDLQLSRVDMGLGDEVSCGQLHAADGVLLSTGPKSQCWSSDGVVWHDIT